MPKIILNLEPEDFESLVRISTAWAGGPSVQLTETFQLIGPDRSGEISPYWRYAYWVGTDWAAVILARSYLDSVGHRYQILLDMAENPDMSYVIITDYATSWNEEPATPSTAPDDDAGLWYTHWALFTSRSSAEACQVELAGDGFDPVVTKSVAAPGQEETGSDEWLLRASKEVYVNGLEVRHGYVETVVTRHGGVYNGGHTGRHDDAKGMAATELRQDDAPPAPEHDDHR